MVRLTHQRLSVISHQSDVAVAQSRLKENQARKLIAKSISLVTSLYKVAVGRSRSAEDPIISLISMVPGSLGPVSGARKNRHSSSEREKSESST